MLQPESAPPVDWDEAIVRVKQGDQRAARGLVDHLFAHVMRIIRSHLPRAADEQDLAQDVFMKMFTRIDSYRGEQPFPHWVARIAVNTCFDRLRRQKCRPEVRFADLGEDEAAFIEATFAGPAETRTDEPARDGTEVVEKLMATLNATEQVVLRMLDLEQRSVREISLLTGWGASKVKVTAMRARRKLNENLKRLEITQPV